jgi:hypothetical protein
VGGRLERGPLVDDRELEALGDAACLFLERSGGGTRHHLGRRLPPEREPLPEKLRRQVGRVSQVEGDRTNASGTAHP